MSKFDDTFMEPVDFSDGAIFISREYYTEGEALKIINGALSYDGELDYLDIGPAKDLEKDRVRWGYPSQEIEDYENFDGRPCWTNGACGKGSKKVWRY